MKLEIESERVEEAKRKCPAAKEVLETLFPNLTPRVEAGLKYRCISGWGSGNEYIVVSLEEKQYALVNLNTGITKNGIRTKDELFPTAEGKFELIP